MFAFLFLGLDYLFANDVTIKQATFLHADKECGVIGSSGMSFDQFCPA